MYAMIDVLWWKIIWIWDSIDIYVSFLFTLKLLLVQIYLTPYYR